MRKAPRKDNKTTSPDHTVAEFLIECAEALEQAVVDHDHRDAHYAALAALEKSSNTQPAMASLLRAAEERMRVLARLNAAQIVFSDRREEDIIAMDLRSMAGQVPSYVYHGTVFGRLKSIAERGLVPAMKPVWTDRQFVKEHCQQAVFFTTTWRAAVTWADVAHHRSRGRRDSAGRRPVIIRLLAASLIIELDRIAGQPRCVMVRGAVATTHAEVFVGPLAGLPRWQPLPTAVAD